MMSVTQQIDAPFEIIMCGDAPTSRMRSNARTVGLVVFRLQLGHLRTSLGRHTVVASAIALARFRVAEARFKARNVH